MRLLICYLDTKVTRMFVERVNENGETVVALSSPHNFFFKEEIIARSVNAESVEEARTYADAGYQFFSVEALSNIKPGEGVYFDQTTSTYKASEYGFAILDKNSQRLRLITPLQLSKDKVKAFFIIFPSKFKKIPSYKNIEDVLALNKIIAIMPKDEIQAQLDKINVNEPRVNRVLVARGKEAVHGYDEYFVPLLKLEKKAGKMMEDGRIDFKELESIIEVKSGQELLRRVPPVKPEDGLNVYGDKVVALYEKKEGFLKGEHLVESPKEANIFISDIDGCLIVEGKKVSVSPYAIVKGNVDYDTGNLDFSGSVHILGSVLPGFIVKAKGDVIIDKNADDSYIEAEGSVIVKQGIAGRGAMKIVAGGKVETKYILNSVVEAAGEISVDDSIINSTVFSNDKISVTAKTGKIIGGEISARHEIVVNVAGVEKENLTKLNVGVSLFVEREIVEIRKEAESVRANVNETMMKIKSSFGEGLFADPKKFLSILPPVKKKACLALLAELTSLNKELQQINARRAEAEAKLKLEREPCVIVTDTVYPGTMIGIKRRRKRIEEKLQNVKFFEDPEEKEIRFTSAI